MVYGKNTYASHSSNTRTKNKEKEELERIIEANYKHLEGLGSNLNRQNKTRTPKVATVDSSTSPRSVGRPANDSYKKFR